MEGNATVRAALEQMQREYIGAVVIANAQDMQPRGLVSLRDVLTQIVLPGADLAQRLDVVMITRYVALHAEASAHDAMMAMTRADARYVLVLERDGRLAGVISRSDLQGAHRFARDELVRAIVLARHVSELATAAADTRLFLRRLVAQGMNAEQLG